MRQALWPVATMVAVGALLVVVVSGTGGSPAEDGGPPGWRPELQEQAEQVQRNTRALDDLIRRPDADERVAALETRIIALEERIASLERARGADPAEGDRGAGSASEEAAPSPAETAYARAREALKKKNWTSARDQLAALLEEPLEADLAVQVLRDLGLAWRALGDHARSEEAFSRMYERAEPQSQSRLEALYNLGVAKSMQGDQASGITWMEEIVRAPQAARVQVCLARLRIAEYSVRRRDPDRARSELDRILADLGDTTDRSERWVVERAKQMRKRMDGD